MTTDAARYQDIPEMPINLDGSGLSIGIVMARFNLNVCEGLLSACSAELRKLGVAPEDMLIVTVPGALEVPLALQSLADSGRFDALIALGAVIRGETYHFEVVSNDACRGVLNVQLSSGVPVANGILTTEDDDQALTRMRQKGEDCARTAVEMANLLITLDASAEDDE